MLLRRKHRQWLIDLLHARTGTAAPGCFLHQPEHGSYAAAIDLREIIPDIPRKKWPELIRAQRENNLLTLTRPVLPVHDQGQTNYCWAHGSTRALELLAVYQGARPQLLSAESIAVPLTNGRNEGGSPDMAVKQLQDFGACAASMWPSNDRNAHHATPGWQANAAKHRIEKWAAIKTWDSQVTAAVYQLPHAAGLGWWGHLICFTAADLDDDEHAILWFDNSWGPDWHEQGRSQLDENNGTADLGAFAPLTTSMLSEGIKAPIGL